MLALVRLNVSRRYASLVSCHETLPARPLCMSGAAVRCDGMGAVEKALEWRRECLGRQAAFPLALVVPRDACIARRIALEAVPLAGLLFEDELAGDRLPDEVVETLWRGSILLRLEEDVLRDTGAQLSPGDRMVLRQVIAAGAEGRRATSAAFHALMSESTLRRWLRDRGLPPVGTLLRRMRLEAVRRLEDAGMDCATASRLCGWSDPRASRLARIRAGSRRRVLAAT